MSTGSTGHIVKVRTAILCKLLGYGGGMCLCTILTMCGSDELNEG